MAKARKKKGPTKAKAKQILKEGIARGHKLTKKQKKFFGAIVGGQKPKRKKRKR